MRTLVLNSTYEPTSFISFREMVKLVANNKVDKISAWNCSIKYGEGYDPICGSNMKFYPYSHQVKYDNNIYKFCSNDCAEIFSVDPLNFLHPSIVRLKKYAPRHIKKCKYNRIGIFRRDKNMCQYCGQTYSQSDLTIDHVVPRYMGGETSWENCVACCFKCNNKKDNKTPKMASMKLLHKPYALIQNIRSEYILINNKHKDWAMYIGG